LEVCNYTTQVIVLRGTVKFCHDIMLYLYSSIMLITIKFWHERIDDFFLFPLNKVICASLSIILDLDIISYLHVDSGTFSAGVFWNSKWKESKFGTFECDGDAEKNYGGVERNCLWLNENFTTVKPIYYIEI